MLAGDITITDSQIEIDRPTDAARTPPEPGHPLVISGRSLKIAKVGTSAGGVSVVPLAAHRVRSRRTRHRR
jgi:hypothetical protein